MALDSVAILEQLQTTLQAVITAEAGLANAVTIGVPESPPAKIFGYVTLGSQSTERAATGIFERTTRIMVMLGYRVNGAEATAERDLSAVVDAFVTAIYADLSLGGAVQSATVDSSAADDPDYQLRVGQEYREYPMIVSVLERGAFAPNP